MSNKRNASYRANSKRPKKRYRASVLPKLPDELWYHIASHSPDALTWLNLAIAVPVIGRWSMSKEGVDVSNALFSSLYSWSNSDDKMGFKFTKNGKLHRDGDKPAIVWEDQKQKLRYVNFYKNGKPYREDRLPTSLIFLKNQGDVVWRLYHVSYHHGFSKWWYDSGEHPVDIYIQPNTFILRSSRDIDNDDKCPLIIHYSTDKKEKKIVSYRREFQPIKELYDNDCEYAINTMLDEFTKDSKPYYEDTVFDWNS